MKLSPGSSDNNNATRPARLSIARNSMAHTAAQRASWLALCHFSQVKKKKEYLVFAAGVGGSNEGSS